MLNHDKDVVVELQVLIEEKPSQPKKRINHVKKKFKSGCKLRMDAQIGDYDMDYIILDLSSDVNISTWQTWETMGKPRLDWSLVQLRIANQMKVL